MMEIKRYCSYCGELTNITPIFIGFDTHTRERRFTYRYDCPTREKVKWSSRWKHDCGELDEWGEVPCDHY
jgi:hypothetical protein